MIKVVHLPAARAAIIEWRGPRVVIESICVTSPLVALRASFVLTSPACCDEVVAMPESPLRSGSGQYPARNASTGSYAIEHRSGRLK
jgi:hypothetical protein